MAACEAVPATSPSVVARDSGGVVIVESAAPQWEPSARITVEPEPLLDLATVGSGAEHEFFNVVDATRFPDGTIAVAERRAGTIRFFSPSGDFIESVGRSGEGPGEFAGLVSIDALDGDSLLAFDPRTQRVTIYGPRRQVSRVIPLTPQFLRAVHLFDGRALLIMVGLPGATVEGDPGHVRTPGRVLLASLDGEVTDTLASTVGGESVRLEAARALLDARPFFGKNSYLAVLGDRFYLGDSDAMQFQVHGPDGRLERIARAPGYDLALTAGQLDAEIATRLEINSTPRNRELIDRLPVPPNRPAYADLKVDLEGNVWLAEHNGWFRNLIGPEPRKWEVFGPGGEWLGSVELPARFQVFEIGSDYVLGLLRDDVDIERPQLLRLNRP